MTKSDSVTAFIMENSTIKDKIKFLVPILQ